MMKQLQQMQAKMAKMQEDLGEMVVSASSGGGAVTVEADGHQKVRSVTIDPEAMTEGAEMLSDLVLVAVNQALDEARAQASQQMGQLTAGLNLPPGLL